MKKAKLSEMSTDKLVKDYVQIGILQYNLDYDEIRKYNRSFLEKRAIEAELKTRPGDQRRALMALYDYPNMQVRLNAATATLAVAPKAARRLLEDIRASFWVPQCYEAGSRLRNLDDGTFKPT
ncbi:DUF2019 domain-containing protein [Roseixanthobacter glucoisosaccharinicivorans]|uniref:DUF2019 domain-containing protein n=1 Tax=Roseixanthobacter glucoisosaccharinicivorans TaxID=3119923 RepID=UPI00372897A0